MKPNPTPTKTQLPIWLRNTLIALAIFFVLALLTVGLVANKLKADHDNSTITAQQAQSIAENIVKEHYATDYSVVRSEHYPTDLFHENYYFLVLQLSDQDYICAHYYYQSGKVIITESNSNTCTSKPGTQSVTYSAPEYKHLN